MAVAGRSRAQVMAVDLLDAPAPMTEAQAATLARRGVVPDEDLTWVQASLLIDEATGSTHGERAANWLRAHGASAQEAANAVECAAKDMRTAAPPRAPGAVAARLEVLEGCDLSASAAREPTTLRTPQVVAARARWREERRAWARKAPAGPAPQGVPHVPGRPGSGRPPPRIAR